MLPSPLICTTLTRHENHFDGGANDTQAHFSWFQYGFLTFVILNWFHLSQSYLVISVPECQAEDGHTKVILPSRPQSVCISAQTELPDTVNWL